jgi:hypothetical protein
MWCRRVAEASLDIGYPGRMNTALRAELLRRMEQDQAARHGTQVTVQDGQHVPNNLRDPGTADQRRAAMDLMPLADYLKLSSGPPRPPRLKSTGA